MRHDHQTPDLEQNPYHPFEETERHRAFQEGWEARRRQKPRADCPYNLSDAEMALPWLDGWTAAGEQERQEMTADRSPVPRRAAALRGRNGPTDLPEDGSTSSSSLLSD